jgi:N-acetylglucosaminyldiphosphoundecaprenol N-acetyl-beta-D-mannosaminyltransferase
MYLRHGDISWDQADGGEGGAALALAKRSFSRDGQKRAETLSHTDRRWPVIELHGVMLHALTEKQCVSHILEDLDALRGGIVVTPNLDHLRRCVKDLNFGALVAEADLVVADGMPLVWASRIQGTPLPERVAGSNLISSLSAAAAGRQRSVFLLGGAEGTAQGTADILRKRHPELKIAGVLCPRHGFENKPRQMAEVVAKLLETKPDIVFVALGSPKQEYVITKLRQSLPQTWWLGVGVSFSFLTGHVKRAPLWMQRYGIEWLHRLFQEPRRLFKRYIVVGLPFATNMLARSTIKGAQRRWGRKTLVEAPVAAPQVEVTAAGFLRAPVSGNFETPANLAERRAERARRSATTLSADSTSLSRLKALVLLGGHVRPTNLSTSIGRSLLDLPVDENGSVLNQWLSHAMDLAKAIGLERLPVRVMVDRTSPEPISAEVKYFGTFRVERDQSEYRGTGGVLGDMAANYHDDDLILVANAAQILLDPLVSLATSLDKKHGDIAVISHRDGTPSGMMLVSCKTLRLIPSEGFVDMKEQAMPLIAQSFAVEVVHCRRPTGLPIRSVVDYLTALRFYHLRKAGKMLADPLAEDWQPSFGIVEQGAIIDPSVRVHDSVVLRGGVVETGATLVRSVVCPSAIVKRDRTVVDDFIRPVTLARIGAVGNDSPPRPGSGSDKGKAA